PRPKRRPDRTWPRRPRRPRPPGPSARRRPRGASQGARTCSRPALIYLPVLGRLRRHYWVLLVAVRLPCRPIGPPAASGVYSPVWLVTLTVAPRSLASWRAAIGEEVRSFTRPSLTTSYTATRPCPGSLPSLRSLAACRPAHPLHAIVVSSGVKRPPRVSTPADNLSASRGSRRGAPWPWLPGSGPAGLRARQPRARARRRPPHRTRGSWTAPHRKPQGPAAQGSRGRSRREQPPAGGVH